MEAARRIVLGLRMNIIAGWATRSGKDFKYACLYLGEFDMSLFSN